MTILLSGSNGFLGSNLLKKFTNLNYKIIALKRSTSNTSRIKIFSDKVIFYNIDKTNLSEIFNKHEIDIVINTVTDYGRKNKKISSIIDTNLVFSLKLLEKSVDNNVKCFINTDTLLERNINAYALSKAQLVDWMKYLSKTNLKMINIKIEHMYGPQDDENKFIYWLINQLKLNVDKIDLTSGIQKRDFVYIDDVVSAYKIILDNLNDFLNFEEFELGSGKSIKIKDFINLIYSDMKSKQELSTKLNFGLLPYRKNEIMDMQANISKLKSLGWESKVSLENGIKNLLEQEIYHEKKRTT